MEVKVHEQEKRFYLAAAGWLPMAGNEITIGKHSFCATPYADKLESFILFSEVSSGSRVKRVRVGILDMIALDTKKKYLDFIESESIKLVKILGEQKDLDNKVLEMERMAIERFGPKPPTEEIDVSEGLEEEES